MSIGMLGQKLGMTQIFTDKGIAVPVTILQVGPCIVTNIRNYPKHQSIQIGYKLMNPKKLKKPEIGYFHKKFLPCFKYLKEYINESKENMVIGQTLTVENFQVGSLISISGISIGKGFSGYQKRHHFSRGPMSHGSKNHRLPGSIGAGTTPGRVFPGKKMSGRMGGKQITMKNLQIIDINISNNLLVIKGSVPGKIGNIIKIQNK